MTAIKTINLTKKYGKHTAVDKLNLEIYDGELFALLGVNGAGKTTTVKMLSTLTQPSGGDALIFGYSILRDAARIKEIVDISMQESAIARKLSVEENLEFYARLNGQNATEIQNNKERVYQILGLNGVAKKRAGQLSGGWQRKLSIALSLITNPRLLFLDEPTQGLDVLSRRELWSAIEDLKGKMTIILTTHYIEEAEALADRIGVMKDGALIFVGTKDEMYAYTGKHSVEEAFIQIVSGGFHNE
ncbi:MAG: ATP-binding cassette domain-containing protein [Clostridia bacterium]|nr:ATP-binding cassette domain-containing protein [Clostridia bacterium]